MMPRKMSIYIIFAIERNIFAIMKKYKYNSSSNETMFTISFTPERGPLCKTTHQPHSVFVMCVYVGRREKQGLVDGKA